MTQIKFIAFLLVLALTACTDVIDVDLQSIPARLTIEASLDWEKGTSGNNQLIKLSTSTPYFDTTTNTAVTDASVRVINDTSGEEFIFVHQNNGAYTTSSFLPIIDQAYTLEVIYKGEAYIANEKLMPVADITDVVQTTEEGDEDLLEVVVVFTDPIDEENYYLFKFKEPEDLLPDLEYGEDEFINGNEITWYFEKEEDDPENIDELVGFKTGDIVNIEMFGISKNYADYLNILITQSESDGGPFDTTPVQLKGNCTNKTNPDHYANGYFRVTQVNRTSYTFE
jgi:hypothetical protein